GAGYRFEFSPDSHSLVANNVDSTELGIWDVATGKKRSTLTGHKYPAGAICFTPDSRRVATGLKAWRPYQPIPPSTEIILWDVDSGERLAILPVDEPTGFNQKITFGNEGRLLLASHRVKQNKLWDLSAWQTASGKGVVSSQITEKQLPSIPPPNYYPIPVF